MLEMEVTDAARDVILERRAQITREGWTSHHDDEHGNGQLARAAASYCLHHSAMLYDEPAEHAASPRHSFFNHASAVWPWAREWWRPKNPRRDLVRAAALILAEIERIDRAALLAGEGT